MLAAWASMITLKRPRLYLLGLRFPRMVLVTSIILAAISFAGALKLQLVSDMTALLPRETESVRDMNQVKKDFGGASPLVMTVESENPDVAARFAGDFATRLATHPQVVFVDHQRPVDFFRKRQWLYFNLDDLREMERRVDGALKLEKNGVSSIFRSLTDFVSDGEQTDLSFRDIVEKYEKKVEWVSRDRLADGDGRLVVLRARLRDQAENIDTSRALLREIRLIEAESRRALDGPAVTVGYAGNYQSKIETVDRIQFEIQWISVLVSIVLLVILVTYFRSRAAAILVGIPLLVSVLWTGGLVYLLLGHVNLITGFGAAILGGLGSDYGIYLLTRFFQERKEGRDLPTACELAFSQTGRATFASMITTVGAFLALLLSDFGIFREFGLVGALGLVTTYLTMMVLLPSLLVISEKWRRTLPRAFGRTKTGVLHGPFFLPSRKGAVTAAVIALCAVAAFSLPRETRIQFDDGALDASSLPSNRLYDRVSRLMNASLNPTILLTEGPEEEKKVVRAIEGLIQRDATKSLVFNQVAGITSFLPEQEEAKRSLLRRLTAKYENLRLVLKSQKKLVLDSLRDTLTTSTVSEQDLPPEITRLFRSPRRDGVRVVYLFPSFPRTDAGAMHRYHDGIRQLRRDLGLKLVAADGSFVASDTIRLINREAPKGMIFVLAFLAIVLVFVIRPVAQAFVIFGHLLASLCLLSGLMWIARIPLNVVNIAVIPIVLGTGIDCFVHFYHRYRETGSLEETIPIEVPPMFLSNLTSMVGFGGLLFSSSGGLRSVGWVAILGLGIVTLLGIFVFPRVLSLLWERAPMRTAERHPLQAESLALTAEPDS